MNLLTQAVVTNLQRGLTPALHILHCGFHSDLSENYPLTWRDDNFQGLLVHTYSNDHREELFHLRLRKRIDDPCKGKWCPQPTYRWEEKGWHNGEMVSLNVLRALYAAGQVEFGEVEPGRGKFLAEVAWRVLR